MPAPEVSLLEQDGVTMRTLWLRVMLAALGVALWALPAAAQDTQPVPQQSLAEQARAANKNKPAPSPATKVWTNDNIPTTSGISTVGTAPAAAPSADTGEKTATAAATTPRSPEEMKNLEAEWRGKFKAQKDQIALLERELTVSKRENQIRATTYYADAGNRLRDEGKYAADDRKYQAEAAAKQQQLDAAKQKLEDMKEELRKAGLPSSWAE